MDKTSYKSRFHSVGTGAYLMGLDKTADGMIVVYDDGRDIRKFQIIDDTNAKIIDAIILSSIDYPNRLSLLFSALKERDISFQEIDPYN
jgi:hypothetical protein